MQSRSMMMMQMYMPMGMYTIRHGRNFDATSPQ